MNILQWNINGRGITNYTIPQFVLHEIIDSNVDIAILTEFSSRKGDFQRNLNGAGYAVFYNQFRYDKNKVLIAIKSEIASGSYGVNIVESIVNANGYSEPNFLQITFEYLSELITVIGTRIRVTDGKENDYKERRIQFRSLINHLRDRDKENIILLGDFNNSRIIGNENKNSQDFYKGKYTEHYNYHMIKDEFSRSGFDLHTPKGRVNSWGGYIKNDHMAVSEKIKVTSLNYAWGFTEDNDDYIGVDSNDSETWKKWRNKSDRVGIPDHAMLLSTIDIHNSLCTIK